VKPKQNKESKKDRDGAMKLKDISSCSENSNKHPAKGASSKRKKNIPNIDTGANSNTKGGGWNRFN
jgi:hypothetical protein